MSHHSTVLIHLVMLALWLPVADAQSDTQTAPAALRGAADALRNGAHGSVQISYSEATAAASFARVQRGGDLMPGLRTTSPEARVEGFVARHAALFGLHDGTGGLSRADRCTDQYGHTRLSYPQIYQGLPVFAGILRFHLSSDGRLTAVNGVIVPMFGPPGPSALAP